MIEIYDECGKLVDQTKAIVKHKLPLDLSRLPDGIYFLRIRSGSDVRIHKLVIFH